jgi:cell division transport system ATP-binding protein
MIKLDKVSKKYGTGVFALSEISLSVEKGEFVFLVGPTGSGKTTIFRLLIRDLLPSTGAITVADFDIVKLPHRKIPFLRKKIGFVFQDLKLLLDQTIFENIALSLEIANIPKTEVKKRVEEVLEKVGIINHKDKFPIQLSGGELQRAAIARALVLSPDIVLADEPTGNLDLETSWEIVKLLESINEKGTTIIMATHNIEIVKNLSKRVIGLDKGRLVRDDKERKDKK